MADVERIPLFPLNTVLFPGVWLPLQIFEERYKIMLRDCGMVEGKFGVVLIREGQEVGGDATPFTVGTIARIARVVPLEDQRLFVQTQGMRRFRVQRLIHDRPYLEADVTPLEAVGADRGRTRSALARVVTEYKRYIDVLRALGGQIMDAPHNHHDPEFFSWLVASTLMVPPTVLQEILETDDIVSRLTREHELLEESTRVLQARADRKGGARSTKMPFSLN